MAPSCASERAVAVLRGFGYRWPGARHAALAGIDLAVQPGELVWLGGPSGAGKTTLLRALAGALPAGGRSEGRLQVAGRPALLFQNVETQLLTTTAGEEVAFGLELRGVPEDERARRVGDALAALGLAGFARRPVQDLSAGEKQRVVLAALLALEPGLLLLDEPSGQLDPGGRRRLAACLAALKRAGHAVLVADHLLAPYAELADRRVRLKEGRLAPASAPDEAPAALPAPAPALPAAGTAALVVEGLRVRDASGRERLRGVSLCVRSGERLLLTGPNGSGKSTLLRVAAGGLRPAEGRVRVCGGEPRAGRVALLFQDPQRNLFERSVREEVAFGLRRLGWPRARARVRVRQVLERCGLAPLAERSPLRLSFGEQHRLALAAVLAPGPDVLLLDEPFAGLDPESRHRLLDLLAREQAQRGFGLVVASHDELPAPGWAHRRVELRDGGRVDG